MWLIQEELNLIEKAAHIYGEADKAGIFYAMGITQFTAGVWGTSIPNEPGLTILEMMDATEAGIVKAMYIMGENPVIADANANHVKHALNHLDFL